MNLVKNGKRMQSYRIFLLITLMIGLVLFLYKRFKSKSDSAWRAIIAFNDNRDVTEDWGWFFGDIKEAFQDKGVFVVYAEFNNPIVSIGSRDTPIATIDITDYLEKYHMGYLFVREGDRPRYHNYDQSVVVVKSASEYFGIAVEP